MSTQTQTTSNYCFCIGPEKCKNTECTLVKNMRSLLNEYEDKISALFDELHEKLDSCNAPHGDDYQELEDQIVGPEAPVTLPWTTVTNLGGGWTYPAIYYNGTGATSAYDPCENCSNNIKNGGTGICHCTIPYFNGPQRITW